MLIVTAGLGDVPGLAAVSRLVAPVTVALGLDQDWRIFAPEPRREGLRIEATTLWADGSRTAWRVPDRDPVVGAYSDYRWRKWLENAGDDRLGQWLWPRAARYLARTQRAPRRGLPVEIRLFRYTRPVPPPGTSASPPWSGGEVYRARLAPSVP
jgi:hypothetical protein